MLSWTHDPNDHACSTCAQAPEIKDVIAGEEASHHAQIVLSQGFLCPIIYSQVAIGFTWHA